MPEPWPQTKGAELISDIISVRQLLINILRPDRDVLNLSNSMGNYTVSQRKLSGQSTS